MLSRPPLSCFHLSLNSWKKKNSCHHICFCHEAFFLFFPHLRFFNSPVPPLPLFFFSPPPINNVDSIRFGVLHVVFFCLRESANPAAHAVDGNQEYFAIQCAFWPWYHLLHRVRLRYPHPTFFFLVWLFEKINYHFEKINKRVQKKKTLKKKWFSEFLQLLLTWPLQHEFFFLKELK